MPPDGRWWETEGWNTRILGLADDPAVAVRAETSLREAFPANWAVDLDDLHPFVASSVWLTGAVRLLELGLAISELRPTPAVLKTLRHRDHHLNVWFQLWMGHFLHRAGASLSPDDASDKTRKTPDWIADWPSGRLIVETKRIGSSKWESAHYRVDMDVFFAFQRAIGELPPASSSYHAEIEPRPDLVFGCVSGEQPPYTIDAVAAQRLGADLALDLQNLLKRTPGLGCHALPHGEVVFRPTTGSRPSFSMSGHAADVEHEAVRTLRSLMEAIEQAAAADPSAPVVFATEVCQGASLALRYGAARRALSARKAHVERVAAILIRDGSFYPEEPLPYSVAWIVPGPAFAEIPREFFGGFRQCDLGHLHFEPLLGPRREHKCDPRFG